MSTIFTTGHKNPLIEIPYSSEGELQTLLAKHPQLIPVREINPEASFCVIAGVEVETGAGPIDLVAVDDKAQIYLIENKLVENPECRRSAIAQLLEYASRMAEWNVKKFNSALTEYWSSKGQTFDSAAEAVRHLSSGLSLDPDVVGQVSSAEWKRSFNSRLKSNFGSDGQAFKLIIAGNSISERAMILADYLRRRKLPVYCLEIAQYEMENSQRMYVSSLRASALLRTTPTSRRYLDEKEWLDIEPRELKPVREALLNNFKKWPQLQYDIGTKENNIYWHKTDHSNKLFVVGPHLFSIQTENIIAIFKDDEWTKEWLVKITDRFELKKTKKMIFQSFKLEILRDRGNLDCLTTMIDELLSRLFQSDQCKPQ